MGTSINQGSPDTTGWTVVAACYDNDAFSTEQTAMEIWRAATAQNATFVRQLKSEVVRMFVEQKVAARQSPAEVGDRVAPRKENTITSELAKRSALITEARGYGHESPIAGLFRQLTDYFVARDISGHVGPEHRCKTFAEVRAFKRQLGEIVSAKVRVAEIEHRLSTRRWSESVPILLNTLTRP